MACRMGGIILRPASLPVGTGSSEMSYMILTTCAAQVQNIKWIPGRQVFKVGCQSAASSTNSFQTRRHSWKIAFALEPGGISDPGGQESLDSDGPGIGQTRLGRIVSSGGRQFLEKLNSARKNFPMKIFLLLLGFYTANALATILGQTGDWDVLVAGIVVAAIEGIGMLIYKKPSALPTRRLQSFMGMVNYWKAGVCLGLFVDAFKLGS